MTLSGAAADSPEPSAANGSVFEAGFYSSNGSSPLVTADGIIATINLTPGTISLVTATPEPGILRALFGALLFLNLARKLSRSKG